MHVVGGVEGKSQHNIDKMGVEKRNMPEAELPCLSSWFTQSQVLPAFVKFRRTLAIHPRQPGHNNSYRGFEH